MARQKEKIEHSSNISNPFTLDINTLDTLPDNPDLLRKTFQDERTLKNLKYIIKDLLQGDNSLALREEYAYLNFTQLQTAIKWLLENDFDESFKNELIINPYRLTFKDKPPTPEEFLTSKYIGSMSDSVWWPVRKSFMSYFDPFEPFRTAVLNPSIGSGKSTFTIISLLYIAAHFALMRNPWKFFDKAQTTVFVFALCAVTQSKASEIYTEPIRQLIESSSYWKFCRTHQDMLKEDKFLQESETVEYIPWTMAAPSSVLRTGNGLNWKQISNAGSLLGMNILMGAMTEITFFLESGKGWTPEKLLQFFTKLRQRISNRFQNNYYARFVLDSSPSNLDDPIQNWMTHDAPKNKENFIWTGSRWKLYPLEFPEFCEVENPNTFQEEVKEIHNFDVGFKLYKGGSGKPPVVCENEGEAASFENSDLVWCPIKQVTQTGTVSFLDKAKENPIEFMKDFAGIPAGQADRIFYQGDWIENCFDNGLRNIYGSLTALSHEEPEHLIWNQIHPYFFNKVLDQWYYYYEPSLPRVISVDQSKSKDATCIAMSHIERDPERIDPHTGQSLIVYVTDFTIVLIPKGGMINFDAIKFFIWDLKRLGGLNIKHVSFDNYQSEPTKQFLKRVGFTVDYISVDANNDPYYSYIDLVIHNRWFCGKNIFVKNNMKSLYQARRKGTNTPKIEHFPGDLNHDWESGDWFTCQAGVNAKDTTDAISGNIQLINTYIQDFVPSKIWNPHASYERTYESLKEKSDDLLKKMNFA